MNRTYGWATFAVEGSRHVYSPIHLLLAHTALRKHSPGAEIKLSRFLTENSSEPQNRILKLLDDFVELNSRLESERCLHVGMREIDLNMYACDHA